MDKVLPSGIVTHLTPCYAPTCSRRNLCYSPTCPHRSKQLERLQQKRYIGFWRQSRPGRRKSPRDVPDEEKLWAFSVPQGIADRISVTERNRQEAIYLIVCTERQFVKDMEYIRDAWMHPLKEQDIIPEHRRTEFISQVFGSIPNIISVNTRLRDALDKRSLACQVVEKIGDIFLEIVPYFEPFVIYGARHLYGRHEFEREESVNSLFAQFVETTRSVPEYRKPDLDIYLTKPMTRLARYPLLLQVVLKLTPENNADNETLPQAIAITRGFLEKLNFEYGKTENRFNLMRLDQQLIFKPGEEVDLRLNDEGRKIVYMGILHKKNDDFQVFLLDHMLLFTKPKKTKRQEQLKVYRQPIPLEFLVATNASASEPNNLKKGHDHYGIRFARLGRHNYSVTLWADSALGHRNWLENIYKQQKIIKKSTEVFEKICLNEHQSLEFRRVNCAASFVGGKRVVYGTNDGVYISNLYGRNLSSKVLSLLDVKQVDVLEEYALLIVLSEMKVTTFPLDSLDPTDPMAGLKRGRHILSDTSFFKTGICMVLEPMDRNLRNQPRNLSKIESRNETVLNSFREFHISAKLTFAQFLETKICLGGPEGFKLIDLEKLVIQNLLDSNDNSLKFAKRGQDPLPTAIFRIDNEYLLCYDEYAFYVNKLGQRTRRDFMVYWEGVPTGIALHGSYILAFEPSFIEVRHVETGLLLQVIQGSDVRLLFGSNQPQSNKPGYKDICTSALLTVSDSQLCSLRYTENVT